jgi:hypothetical protein
MTRPVLRRPLTSSREIAAAIRGLAQSRVAGREDLRHIRLAVEELDRSVRASEAWQTDPDEARWLA